MKRYIGARCPATGANTGCFPCEFNYTGRQLAVGLAGQGPLVRNLAGFGETGFFHQIKKKAFGSDRIHNIWP